MHLESIKKSSAQTCVYLCTCVYPSVLQGMDSGFGDDEAYTVYDKPWRDEHTVANNIYRPSKKLDSDLYGDDLDTLMKNKRLDMFLWNWMFCLSVEFC